MVCDHELCLSHFRSIVKGAGGEGTDSQAPCAASLVIVLTEKPLAAEMIYYTFNEIPRLLSDRFDLV